MSGRDALLALAARCEAAEGPSRELDGEIARAAGWTEVHGSVVDPDFLGGKPSSDRPWARVPAYTANLDAALMLVPARAMWAAGVDEDGMGCADMPQHRMLVHARTPALALCAAALRALAEGRE